MNRSVRRRGRRPPREHRQSPGPGRRQCVDPVRDGRQQLVSQIGLVGGLIGELVEQGGSLPAGVLNVFTESGNEGAPLLVSSPDVDILSYTGSTVVGRKIMESAAATLKPLSLELGGKSPMLVFDDADLDATVPVLVKAITTFAGQFCMTGSRVLAQRGIADELRRRLAQALEAVKVGPGDDPASDMGAMIDERNAERVERMVADAAAYADIVVRGERDRAFLRPSLVEVTDLSTPIVQQASPRRSGRAMWTVRCASAGRSRPARCGPTPGPWCTTSSRRAASSSPAWAA